MRDHLALLIFALTWLMLHVDYITFTLKRTFVSLSVSLFTVNWVFALVTGSFTDNTPRLKKLSHPNRCCLN